MAGWKFHPALVRKEYSISWGKKQRENPRNLKKPPTPKGQAVLGFFRDYSEALLSLLSLLSELSEDSLDALLSEEELSEEAEERSDSWKNIRGS